ncbi:DUF805 domain-containing protein [Actinomadura rubrisoli]|nr:DUF805 domain-containing protein [Actinomadura rubrisoli]
MKPHIAVQQGFRRTFSWSGRTSRSEYWWFALSSWLAFALCLSLTMTLENVAFFLSWILIFIIPTLGAAVRRLHDSDHSGGWWFIGFVPYLGALVLLVFYCLPSTLGLNRYGSPSDAAAQAKLARRLGRSYEKHDKVYLAVGYTALSVIFGTEAGKNIDGDMAVLARQREVLGELAFRQRLCEVLGGPDAETFIRMVADSHSQLTSTSDAYPGE